MPAQINTLPTEAINEKNTRDDAVEATGTGQRGSPLRNLSVGKRIWALVGIGAIGVIGLGITINVFQSKLDANQSKLDAYGSIASLTAELEINALQMRRSEKDFLIRKLPKYRDRYLKAEKHGHSVVEKLDQVPEAKDEHDTLQALSKGFETHASQFATVFGLQQSLGFDEKSGLQGALRKAVHSVETELKKAKLDNLTVKMLMMRRHEKDFIMRGAAKYIGRIDKRQAEFRSLLAASTLPPAEQKAINGLLDSYVSNFKKFADVSLTLKKETKKLSTIFADMAPAFKEIKDFAEQQLSAARKAYDQAKSSLMLTLLAITIAIVAVSVLAGYFMARSIVGPVRNLADVVTELADGNTDVNVTGTECRDETGTMAKALEVFRANLIETAALRVEQSETEKRTQEEEGHRAEEKRTAEGKAEEDKRQADAQAEATRKQAMIEMADSFEKSVMGVVEALSSATTEMQSSAETMSATAEQTSQQATAVAAASEEATVNVQTVASSAEELSASIEEISRQVIQSNEIAQSAVNEAKETNENVEGLATAAQKIGDVVNLINDIASQTNLLALNATIEAARAGDAGKGFAVVASEVKSLATQTGKATEEIGAQITAIQGATAEAVQAIQGIGGTIGKLGEIAASVSSAVNQQGSATREIASSVQQAAAGTQEVSGNITQVTQAASETQASAGQMLSAAKELAQQGDVLRSEVDKFLQEVRAA